MSDTEHDVVVDTRPGKRWATALATFYRWTCSCGQSGRWTRDPETAYSGAARHAGKP